MFPLVFVFAAPYRCRAQTIDDGLGALPAFQRTRIAAERPVGFAVRGLLAYGLTESLQGAPGPHQTFAQSLALSGQPLSWLGVSLRFDGHADFHPNDGLGMGRDRGFVGTGALEVRAMHRFTSSVTLGGQLSFLANGATAPSFDFSALSGELTAFSTYTHGAWLVTGELGYRLDRSANSVPNNVVYRPGDRLALGVSSFDAVLIRAGASYAFRPVTVYAEGTFDALVGSAVPRASNGPLHFVVGTRLPIGDAVKLDAFIDLCASSRPVIANGPPYVPVPPRFAIGVSATYRFVPKGARGALPPRTGRETDESPTRDFETRLVDASGSPIVDAHVTLLVGGGSYDGFSDARGRVRITGVPRGRTVVRIEAQGFDVESYTTGKHGEAIAQSDETRLESADVRSALRGVVRDYDGAPLDATVHVLPVDRTVRTRSGSYQVELPAGRYRVVIAAPGFVTQTWTVSLGRASVTVLNVELVRAR